MFLFVASICQVMVSFLVGEFLYGRRIHGIFIILLATWVFEVVIMVLTLL